MANCHFNSVYIICLRRMLAMDRNIAAETRRALVEAIDVQRYLHKKTGCDCWNETLKKMDTPASVNGRAEL